jgi:adenylate cyclase
MAQTVECTVLFADLRGSTSLYETLGNAEAAAVVTQCVGLLSQVVQSAGGRVVKTLGDGLMAVFDLSVSAVEAADQIHDNLARVMSPSRRGNGAQLRVQVALAHGEVVEVNGDCFGDAVNVAARLLDHAGDRETLVTAQTLTKLTAPHQRRFRRLDKIHLRGRQEPVEVYRLDTESGADEPGNAATLFGDEGPSIEPEGIRLIIGGSHRVYASQNLPVILGRHPEAQCFVDDSRVSRMHARIESHGGNFQLVDLSSNGTYVRFGDAAEFVSLRRGSCTLHGSGVVTLGANPNTADAPTVAFQVLRFDDTERQPL